MNERPATREEIAIAVPDEETLDREAITSRVVAVVARSLDRPPSTVTLPSRLWDDLDAESLDMLDILYGLERAFRIRMPRLNLLNRASDLFGEDVIVSQGVITPTGIAVMRLSMPEIPPEWLRPGMRMYDFRKVITVESFVRVVERCLVAVEALRCDRCGGKAIPDENAEMARRCEVCRAPVDLPSGEQLLVEDLKRCARELHLPLAEKASSQA